MLAIGILASRLASAEQRARLELRVNEQRVGEIDVVFRADDILTRVTDLDAAAVDWSNGRVESIHGVQYVSLKSLVRRLSFQLDEADLSLRLTLKTADHPLGKLTVKRPGASVASNIKGLAKPPTTAGAMRNARLTLIVDGVRHGEAAVLVGGADISLRSDDLQTIGMAQTAGRRQVINGEYYVSLNSLAGDLSYVLDERDLSLRLTSRSHVVESELTEAKPIENHSNTKTVAVENNARKSADQRAIFSLRINEMKRGETDVILRRDDILVQVNDLRNAGMVAVSGRKELFDNESYVSLRSLAPLVSYTLDENSLTLNLILAPEAFGENIVTGKDNRPEKLEYSEATSGFLNYAVSASDFNSVGAFGEVGVTIKNALLYSSVSRNWAGNIARGFSNVTVNNRESINRFIVGDRLVNTDSLGGSATLGGLSYFRDFALDPYFVRNPGLNYSGAVSTPSTLDIYSQGRLIRRMPLPPGQFQLQDLPVPVGINDTRLVVRDAFGRERELGSQVFYFTSGLLKPGLHDFSYNLGAERDFIGTKNWSYSNPMFLGYHRYGFTDYLTAGMRLEGARGLLSGGPSFSFSMPLGEMEFVSAASTQHGVSGGATFLGYTYIDRQFSFSSSLKLQSEHYATTSLAADRERSWLAAGVYTAIPILDWISFNMRYSIENERRQALTHRIGVFGNTRLGKRVSLLTGMTLDLRGAERSLGFNFGININLGEFNGSLSYQYDDKVGKTVMDMRKSLPNGPGYGYGLQVDTTGDIDSIFQYQNDFGRYEANYYRLDGRQKSELRAAGGVAWIGGNLKFTRPVQDAFALIDVNGLGGVRGYLNNLEIGKTDSLGRLFVPNLLSYYGNNLSISRKDLPLNYNIDEVSKIIAAPYRGGVLVDFPVKRIQRILGKAAVEKGRQTFVPKHGQLTIIDSGKSVESPLGNDGEFYFENLKKGRHKARIEVADEICDFELEVPETSDEEIDLGTQRCRIPDR